MRVLLFRRLFWRIQKCERCKKILFLSNKDVEFERANLLMRMCGYSWLFGFYCKKCGRYNYILADEIPKKIATEITFEETMLEIDRILKESPYWIRNDEEEIEEDNNQ